MRIDPTSLQTDNLLIKGYRNHDDDIMDKFDYKPFEDTTFPKRVADLRERSFDRTALTSALYEMNRKWDAPEGSIKNIERLQDESSVVVIGGQQAGLLSGPLYTIHKIISILTLSKKQEAELEIPVIPVFWIAGEDHDFDEINHVMTPEENRLKKHKINHRVHKKQSVSGLELDKEEAHQWVDTLFEKLAETEHTKTIYEEISAIIAGSDTYVDFFAKFIHHLFPEEGLVLVDSANHSLRKIESKSFLKMIENQHPISSGVYEAVQQSKLQGLSINMDVEPNDAHLFYHKDGERVLLSRTVEGKWIGKQGECELSNEEMRHIASYHPELLSNNVVTRPIMQELLFPSLAFIGGQGEIGYWSVLQPAFKAMGLYMPPIMPRLSLTLINRQAGKYLQKFSLRATNAVNNGVKAEKIQWLSSQSSPPIEQLTDEIKQSVEKVHEPLRNTAKEIRSDLGELAEKNLNYLFNNIEYLQDRLLKALQEHYDQELNCFDLIDVMLYPNGGLQERSWNIIYWLNAFGYDFLKRLASEHYSFEEEHFLVYL